MRKPQCYLTFGIVIALVPGSLVSATPASADCDGAGYATICAQGDVRGGGPTPPQAGPVYPGYCSDPWYCDDGWDLDVILPIPPNRPGGPGGPGRPGRPGRG
ncbi:hypothetical protein K9U37_09660 [Mycolicibacterium litorale]|uniref:Secreted protein n=1 Tax=Candidatus Mycolicibacterium alkanivorans TaxID=2954114 RepID=A0ABS9YV90_9MYCO|nr:hypothetical protein [Candidatus Mycolicibacterium alkanivorans]